jgi:FAD:protein FMN transferase
MNAGDEIAEGWSHGVSGTALHADRVVHVEHVWGTVITINLAGTAGRDADAVAAIEGCCAYFAHVDATFSTYKALSEVTLHRAGLDRPSGPSPEFREVMEACRHLRSVTQGAFDPWAVPGGYDPSGYVKGWAAGRASERLYAAGLTDHLVNAGGDICARGDELPGSGGGWPVGILNPHDTTAVIEVVSLRNQSLATSGRYERGDHVIDPATGAPAVGVDSASVVGPDPGVADALASAALVCGEASTAWLADLGPEWSLYLVVGGTALTFGPAFG